MAVPEDEIRTDGQAATAELGRPETGDTVQTIEKAADILGLIASSGGLGARLTDVVARTALSKSTAYRLLTALVRAGLLDQEASSRVYFLGLKLVGFGEVAANRLGLADFGLDVVDALAAKTQDTIYLSARTGNEAVCLARASGAFPIKILTLNVGDRSPLGAGAGSLALLAAMPDEEMRRIVQENGHLAGVNPLLAEAPLLDLIAEARRLGYARTDGRIVVGMSSIGVPVVASSGIPIAAISLAAISERLSPERSVEIVALLQSEAAALAARLKKSLGTLSRRMIGRIVATSRKQS